MDAQWAEAEGWGVADPAAGADDVAGHRSVYGVLRCAANARSVHGVVKGAADTRAVWGYGHKGQCGDPTDVGTKPVKELGLYWLAEGRES